MEKLFTIVPEATAITTGNSYGSSFLNKYAEKDLKILDYGCGKLRNSMYLIKKGFKNISILDSDTQINNIKNKVDLSIFSNVFSISTYNPKPLFDIVLCSFVLNVIEDYIIRVKVLDNIYNSLKENGYLLLEVRNKASLYGSKTIQEYKDGYILGKGNIKTFQKTYDKESLKVFIEKESRFKIVSIQNTSGSIFCLLKK